MVVVERTQAQEIGAVGLEHHVGGLDEGRERDLAFDPIDLGLRGAGYFWVLL